MLWVSYAFFTSFVFINAVVPLAASRPKCPHSLPRHCAASVSHVFGGLYTSCEDCRLARARGILRICSEVQLLTPGVWFTLAFHGLSLCYHNDSL